MSCQQLLAPNRRVYNSERCGYCPPFAAQAVGVLAGAAVACRARHSCGHASPQSHGLRHPPPVVALCGPFEEAAATSDSDEGLPTDEELRQSFNARLPWKIRAGREATFQAEKTLQRADEQIAAMGIDLVADEKARSERDRLFPDLGGGPPVAVCFGSGQGLGSSSEKEASVCDALQVLLPATSVRWVELGELCVLSSEGIEERLGGCEAVAVCPGPNIESACAGISALLQRLPKRISRIVLLASSSVDVASSGDNNPLAFLDAAVFGRREKQATTTKQLENILTMAARQRNSNILAGLPLGITLIRATLGITSEPPKVLAKLPSTVREATAGLRAMYIGGLGAMTGAEEGPAGSLTSCTGAVASALAFVLQRGVDINDFTVIGCDSKLECDWDEILLPLVGPEIWRIPVEEPNRCRRWIRAWVDFNFCRGAERGATAMRRAGLRTPVEVRETPLGVCMKFMPAGAREPGVGFDGLTEGGLEISVDDARAGIPGRLRVRRCAYGRDKKPRETSERTILSRLRRDWEVSQSFDKSAVDDEGR